MNYKLFLLSLMLLCGIITTKGQHRISGYVSDSETGECLIGATILDRCTSRGSVTNSYGFFSMVKESAGIVTLEVSYIGYKKDTVQLNLNSDTLIHINLQPGIEMGEVVVSAQRIEDFIASPQMGAIELQASLTSKLPAFMGEADLARTLQLMPGVQSGKEGTSGMFVRGGSSDQNLILLDGVPIYNPNHIGGFISVFNPSSINYLKLYKGGFPVKFGGRLSSVLDVRMKEGDINNKHVNYTIGTITSKYTIQGPVIKDTSSFIISARRTMFDLFTSAAQLLNTNGEFYGGYKLWDINAKYNKKVNEHTRYYLSFYKGRDKIFRNGRDRSSDDDFPYNVNMKSDNAWGNTAVAFKLNKIYRNQLFANYTASVSNYSYSNGEQVSLIDKSSLNKIGEEKSSMQSGITDISLNVDLMQAVRSNNILYGASFCTHINNPAQNIFVKEVSDPAIADVNTTWGAPTIVTPELSAYISDEFAVSEGLNFNVGSRFNATFIEKELKFDIQPRITASYVFDSRNSIKLSYAKMQQLTHLISSGDNALPTDVWLPSTKKIKPEKSHQINLGFFHLFGNQSTYKFSVETYYKTMQQLIELKNGSSIIGAGSSWETNLITGGKGRAYGAELLLSKDKGRLTGWLAYTLSKNERRFSSINDNTWYPYKYDRRHDLSLVVNYEISPRVNFAATWVYMSGEALTLPSYKYDLDVVDWENPRKISRHFNQVHYYGGRNRFRAPSYHRLDFNFNFEKRIGRGVRTWSIGVYNAYNHPNPYYLYFDKNDKGQIKLYSYSLFPILPSISYSFRY